MPKSADHGHSNGGIGGGGGEGGDDEGGNKSGGGTQPQKPLSRLLAMKNRLQSQRTKNQQETEPKVQQKNTTKSVASLSNTNSVRSTSSLGGGGSADTSANTGTSFNTSANRADSRNRGKISSSEPVTGQNYNGAQSQFNSNIAAKNQFVDTRLMTAASFSRSENHRRSISADALPITAIINTSSSSSALAQRNGTTIAQNIHVAAHKPSNVGRDIVILLSSPIRGRRFQKSSGANGDSEKVSGGSGGCAALTSGSEKRRRMPKSKSLDLRMEGSGRDAFKEEGADEEEGEGDSCGGGGVGCKGGGGRQRSSTADELEVKKLAHDEQAPSGGASRRNKKTSLLFRSQSFLARLGGKSSVKSEKSLTEVKDSSIKTHNNASTPKAYSINQNDAITGNPTTSLVTASGTQSEPTRRREFQDLPEKGSHASSRHNDYHMPSNDQAQRAQDSVDRYYESQKCTQQSTGISLYGSNGPISSLDAGIRLGNMKTNVSATEKHLNNNYIEPADTMKVTDFPTDLSFHSASSVGASATSEGVYARRYAPRQASRAPRLTSIPPPRVRLPFFHPQNSVHQSNPAFSINQAISCNQSFPDAKITHYIATSPRVDPGGKNGQHSIICNRPIDANHSGKNPASEKPVTVAVTLPASQNYNQHPSQNCYPNPDRYNPHSTHEPKRGNDSHGNESVSNKTGTSSIYFHSEGGARYLPHGVNSYFTVPDNPGFIYEPENTQQENNGVQNEQALDNPGSCQAWKVGRSFSLGHLVLGGIPEELAGVGTPVAGNLSGVEKACDSEDARQDSGIGWGVYPIASNVDNSARQARTGERLRVTESTDTHRALPSSASPPSLYLPRPDHQDKAGVSGDPRSRQGPRRHNTVAVCETDISAIDNSNQFKDHKAAFLDHLAKKYPEHADMILTPASPDVYYDQTDDTQPVRCRPSSTTPLMDTRGGGGVGSYPPPPSTSTIPVNCARRPSSTSIALNYSASTSLPPGSSAGSDYRSPSSLPSGGGMRVATSSLSPAGSCSPASTALGSCRDLLVATGGRDPASLMVVRSPNKSMERPLGQVFLIYRAETKRAILPNEVTSIDTVRALFVRAFPRSLSMRWFDSALRKIYILDNATKVFYELDDLCEIQDRVVLKIYEEEDFVTPHSSLGALQQARPVYDSLGVVTGRNTPMDYPSSISGSLLAMHSSSGTTTTGQHGAGLPGHAASVQHLQRTISPPIVASVFRTAPGACSSLIGQRHSVAYLPAVQGQTRLPQSQSFQNSFLNGGDGESGGASAQGSGSVTPTGDDVATRSRMQKMETQLASLTSWVQSAMYKQQQQQVAGCQLGRAAVEGASSSSSGSGTVVASAKSSVSDVSGCLPSLVNCESSLQNTSIICAVWSIRRQIDELKSDLTSLRRIQVANYDYVRSTVLDVTQKITLALTDERDARLWPAERTRRLAVELHSEAYRQEAEYVNSGLRDLETLVEDIRKDVVSRKCRVNMAEVESMALALSQHSRALANLKNVFPSLQEKMKSVMASEIEVVVQEERFLKEEPIKIEESLKRSKRLMGTLFTLKKLASVQDKRPVCAPLLNSANDITHSDRRALLLSIQAVVPDHTARQHSIEMAAQLRNRKQKLTMNIDCLRFEKTLELAQRHLKETDNIARNEERRQRNLQEIYNQASIMPTSCYPLTEVLSSKNVSAPQYSSQNQRPGMTQNNVTVDNNVRTSSITHKTTTSSSNGLHSNGAHSANGQGSLSLSFNRPVYFPLSDISTSRPDATTSSSKNRPSGSLTFTSLSLAKNGIPSPPILTGGGASSLSNGRQFSSQASGDTACGGVDRSVEFTLANLAQLPVGGSAAARREPVSRGFIAAADANNCNSNHLDDSYISSPSNVVISSGNNNYSVLPNDMSPAVVDQDLMKLYKTCNTISDDNVVLCTVARPTVSFIDVQNDPSSDINVICSYENVAGIYNEHGCNNKEVQTAINNSFCAQPSDLFSTSSETIPRSELLARLDENNSELPLPEQHHSKNGTIVKENGICRDAEIMDPFLPSVPIENGQLLKTVCKTGFLDSAEVINKIVEAKVLLHETQTTVNTVLTSGSTAIVTIAKTSVASCCSITTSSVTVALTTWESAALTSSQIVRTISAPLMTQSQLLSNYCIVPKDAKIVSLMDHVHGTVGLDKDHAVNNDSIHSFDCTDSSCVVNCKNDSATSGVLNGNVTASTDDSNSSGKVWPRMKKVPPPPPPRKTPSSISIFSTESMLYENLERYSKQNQLGVGPSFATANQRPISFSGEPQHGSRRPVSSPNSSHLQKRGVDCDSPTPKRPMSAITLSNARDVADEIRRCPIAGENFSDSDSSISSLGTTRNKPHLLLEDQPCEEGVGKRGVRGEGEGGAKRRLPPPVPVRKTSALSLGVHGGEGAEGVQGGGGTEGGVADMCQYQNLQEICEQRALLEAYNGCAKDSVCEDVVLNSNVDGDVNTVRHDQTETRQHISLKPKMCEVNSGKKNGSILANGNGNTNGNCNGDANGNTNGNGHANGKVISLSPPEKHYITVTTQPTSKILEKKTNGDTRLISNTPLSASNVAAAKTRQNMQQSHGVANEMWISGVHEVKKGVSIASGPIIAPQNCVVLKASRPVSATGTSASSAAPNRVALKVASSTPSSGKVTKTVSFDLKETGVPMPSATKTVSVGVLKKTVPRTSAAEQNISGGKCLEQNSDILAQHGEKKCEETEIY